MYESSGDPIEFALWDEGEPSNHDGQEHCVEVVTIKDGKWNDIPCSWKVGFVCQNQAHQSNQTRPSSGQKEIMFDCYRTDKLTRFAVTLKISNLSTHLYYQQSLNCELWWVFCGYHKWSHESSEWHLQCGWGWDLSTDVHRQVCQQ